MPGQGTPCQDSVNVHVRDARDASRFYLGAAPGVGKTYRMLDEGRRRAGRGADVVVAFAECHGRPRTAAMLDGLEVVPPVRCAHRGGEFEELDLAAVLDRRPEVAVVDERTRETFAMESAELVDEPPDMAGVTAVPAGSGSCPALHGPDMSSSERRVLAAFAAHVGAAVERARLAEAAAEVEPVKAADRMRTALLRAVGHDLRTPPAAGWAAVTSLRSRDVEFSVEDRDELLAAADESMAKLNRLVENLLDLSRLEAGVLRLNLRPTMLEEVLPAALADTPGIRVGDVEKIPEVLADPPLLERVIANLVANAARYSPPGTQVLVTASALGGRAELRVVARGPGLPATGRERLFEPFQRLGDTDNSTGLGLGLAPARGLTEAMSGTVTPEDTPGVG